MELYAATGESPYLSAVEFWWRRTPSAAEIELPMTAPMYTGPQPKKWREKRDVDWDVDVDRAENVEIFDHIPEHFGGAAERVFRPYQHPRSGIFTMVGSRRGGDSSGSPTASGTLEPEPSHQISPRQPKDVTSSHEKPRSSNSSTAEGRGSEC